MVDQDDLKRFAAQASEREFEIGGVSFEVHRMLPMEQYRLLNQIRSGLQSVGTVELPDDTSLMAASWPSAFKR